MLIINERASGISITKGDSADITINITGENVPNNTDAFVTLKDPDDMGQNVWQIETAPIDNVLYLEFTAEHTNLLPKKYVWDIRFVYSSGKVYTPIPPSPFIILEPVGEINEGDGSDG